MGRLGLLASSAAFSSFIVLDNAVQSIKINSAIEAKIINAIMVNVLFIFISDLKGYEIKNYDSLLIKKSQTNYL